MTMLDELLQHFEAYLLAGTVPPDKLTFITNDDETQITTTIRRATIPRVYRLRLPDTGIGWPVSVIRSD